jgi:hypothetical protein
MKEQETGPVPTTTSGDNWANFIQAVRSRKQSELNAPVEEGVPSVVLIHLVNISYRLGRTLHFRRRHHVLQRRCGSVVPEKV